MDTQKNTEKMWNILQNLNALEQSFLEKTPDISAFDDIWTYWAYLDHHFIQSNRLASIYFPQLPKDINTMNSFWKNMDNLDEICCIYSGLDIQVTKQFNLPNFRAHSSSCFECIYVLQGSGTFRLSDETFSLQQGDFFFHSPGEKYLLNSEPGSILINLDLRQSYIHQVYQTLFSNCPAAMHFFDSCYQSRSKHNYLCFHTENQTDFHTLILLMLYESLSSGKFKNDILKHYFELLMIYLKRYGTNSISASGKLSSKEAHFNNIVVYLTENYRTATLESAAAHCHLTKNYISRIVHSMTGGSFVEYLSQIRIRKVTEYLDGTDLGLEDIAELTGFSDSSYLWRVYKKQTGLSPSEYRRIQKNESSRFSNSFVQSII